MLSTEPTDIEIAQRIEELLAKRAATASICPSEVARSLATEEAAWRTLMPQVRCVADALASHGRIVVTQRGKVVSAVQAKGAIRLAKRSI